MAVRKLVKTDNPILKQKAAPVKKVTSLLKTLFDDMVETMHYHQGVGLAAPQLGISKQLIVVDTGEGPIISLANPSIVDKSGEYSDVEGCLSVPGIYGEVNRYERVQIQGVDEHNQPVNINAEGFLARVLQHEIDHLQGVLFVEKASRFIKPEELAAQEERRS